MLKSIEHLEGNLPGPITFNDIRGYIQNYMAVGFEKDWKVTSLNALFKLTTGPIGRLFNSPGTATMNDILEDPVILELDSLGSKTDRSAFTQALFFYGCITAV